MNDFKRRIYVVVLICLMYLPHTVVPYFQYPSVYWAPKNCRFNLNKPGKSRYEFKVKQFGKLYFVCPNIALWNDISNTGVQKSMMYENLMLVDEVGYETCTVNRTRNPILNRLILKCHDDASQLTYMEETFAPQRAGNDRMKYESGKTYYFISTSNGTKESLDNLSGGHCKTHNMKLKITVCTSKEQCFFDVPKCPFTDVFDGQNRPTTTTAAPKTTATTPAKHTPDVAGVETNLKTTQKVGTETVSKETETRKPKVQTTTTLPTNKAIFAKHSSDDTNLFCSKSFPGKSCKDILATNTSAVSGNYWIKPASNTLFQVYCDMETHGGGWTLVYSYAFTNYSSFSTSSNAVTPRPNWPACKANVPISTTPPLNESSLGAVEWNVWKDIGKEFMVKSNINDWVVCQPSNGSIVTKKSGSLNCQSTKNVATDCNGVAPKRIFWWPRGPALSLSNTYSHYYFFNVGTDYNWPRHDPCGTGGKNHKKEVSNPGGQIYLR